MNSASRRFILSGSGQLPVVGLYLLEIFVNFRCRFLILKVEDDLVLFVEVHRGLGEYYLVYNVCKSVEVEVVAFLILLIPVFAKVNLGILGEFAKFFHQFFNCHGFLEFRMVSLVMLHRSLL